MKIEQSRAPYYIKFHIGDYIRDAEELSLMQHGAYLRLMLWYYSTAKPIPNQPDRIYRRIHATSAEEKGAVDFVLAEFFRLDGPAWHHKRIDQELSTWNEFSTLQTERARKRHGIKETTPASAEPAQSRRTANQNQNQNQNHKSKSTSASADLPPGFVRFWQSWPKSERKQGKSKCFAIWKRKGLEARAGIIVGHVERMAKSESWRGGYDPMPETYLNGERWDGAEEGEAKVCSVCGAGPALWWNGKLYCAVHERQVKDGRVAA